MFLRTERLLNLGYQSPLAVDSFTIYALCGGSISRPRSSLLLEMPKFKPIGLRRDDFMRLVMARCDHGDRGDRD